MRRVKFQALCGFDDETELVSGGREVTMKDQLVTHCGMFQSKDAVEHVAVFDLGQKIFRAEDEVVLEEAEFTLLKRTLGQPQSTSLVMGRLHKILNTVEKEDA